MEINWLGRFDVSRAIHTARSEINTKTNILHEWKNMIYREINKIQSNSTAGQKAILPFYPIDVFGDCIVRRAASFPYRFSSMILDETIYFEQDYQAEYDKQRYSTIEIFNQRGNHITSIGCSKR